MGKRTNDPTGVIGCTDEISGGSTACGVAQAEIYFRPTPAYDGEFGFDWMRVGDWDWNRTLHATDTFLDNNYRRIISGGKDVVATATMTEAQLAYKKLEDEYTKLPINGQAENYHFHWLSIFPKSLADRFNAQAVTENLHASARLEFSATLTLLIKVKDIANKPDRIIFINGDPDNLDVSTSTGDTVSFNKKVSLPTIVCSNINTTTKEILGEITVTCNGELKHNIPISAYAVKGDSATLAGVLMVCKNNSTKVCKRQDVLVVLIQTNRDGALLMDGADVYNDFVNGHRIQTHEKLIYQTLHHHLLYGKVEKIPLDLTNDIRFRLKTSLVGPDALDPNAEIYCGNLGVLPISPLGLTSMADFDAEIRPQFNYLNSLIDDKYEKHAKLFTFKETWNPAALSGTSGVALDFESKLAINFEECSSFHTTPAHELNHSLGLRHTFGDPDAPYIFLNDGRTDNIMSYSDLMPAMTWYWQWKMVNKKLK